MSATVTQLRPSDPTPEGAITYELVNRFGTCIGTADTAERARDTARYLTRERGLEGVTVHRVERIERRVVVYTPRRKPEPAKPTPAEIELLLEAAKLGDQP